MSHSLPPGWRLPRDARGRLDYRAVIGPPPPPNEEYARRRAALEAHLARASRVTGGHGVKLTEDERRDIMRAFVDYRIKLGALVSVTEIASIIARDGEIARAASTIRRVIFEELRAWEAEKEELSHEVR